MYKKSIAGHKRIFSEAHPKILDGMKNMNELYRTQENLRGSKALDARIKAANVDYIFDVTGNYESTAIREGRCREGCCGSHRGSRRIAMGYSLDIS